MGLLRNVCQLAQSSRQLASSARSGGAAPAAERMNTLVAEIRALGHLPRDTRGLGEEYKLAHRLQYARKEGRLSQAELAELEAIPRYAALPPVAERMARVVAERMTTLMAEIRTLGHLPRRHGNGESAQEKRLGFRLQNAKKKKQLSPAQLAELEKIPRFAPAVEPLAERVTTLMDAIRALGHLPRWKQAKRDNGRTRASSDLEDEYALAGRLREAKRVRRLSEEQLAELAEMPRHETLAVPSAVRMDTLVAEIRALLTSPGRDQVLGMSVGWGGVCELPSARVASVRHSLRNLRRSRDTNPQQCHLRQSA